SKGKRRKPGNRQTLRPPLRTRPLSPWREMVSISCCNASHRSATITGRESWERCRPSTFMSCPSSNWGSPSSPPIQMADKTLLRSEIVKKLRVLIVDDSSVMRKIVERSLRQAGIEVGEVLEASNGAE